MCLFLNIADAEVQDSILINCLAKMLNPCPVLMFCSVILALRYLFSAPIKNSVIYCYKKYYQKENSVAVGGKNYAKSAGEEILYRVQWRNKISIFLSNKRTCFSHLCPLVLKLLTRVPGQKKNWGKDISWKKTTIKERRKKRRTRSN